MADSDEQTLSMEELVATSEDEEVSPALASITDSLEDQLSLSLDGVKSETPMTPGSLFAELAAASNLPKDEKMIPNLSRMEKTSARQQHREAEETPSAEEAQPQPEEKTEPSSQIPSTDSTGNTSQNIAEKMVTKDVQETAGAHDVSVDFLEASCPLGERVQRIQDALSAVTRYSHCHSCLQDKKNQAPDIACVDCALCFCFRCSGRHKATPSCSTHIMLPVEERLKSGVPPPPVPGPLSCPAHPLVEPGAFCRNCEVLACRECLEDQHLHKDCPGTVPLQDYAREEKELAKKCRVKYAQVMRFFSEQRRDTEERMAALNLKKQTAQEDIRKFFSSLIKACMDVEGSLLEELETTVSDHLDLLTEQSRAWQSLQADTQQLLDMADILHFLPNSDFLPLTEASKASLSQALREGEQLAGSTPSEMAIRLSLENSSLRSLIKRVKEIGALALAINTHKTLTLRKVSTMPFTTMEDNTDPLVSAMLLLSPHLLLAADFNNSCLKRFLKEEEGEGWNCTEVLALKWRPYGLTKLSEKLASRSEIRSNPHENGPEDQQTDPSVADQPATSDVKLLKETEDEDTLLGKQAKNGKRGSDTSDVDIHVAVTSPFAGCFEVVVPVSSHRKMSVVRAIDEEKGFWGLGLVSDHKLAVSTIAAGRSYLSLIDTSHNSTQRLSVTSDTTVTPLVSPRHVLPLSPSSFIVGDHGKKAVIHASMEGKVLFNFIGNGSQRVSRPEGLCQDGQGYVYVADSGDHSIFVLTKGGHLYSRTGSQQNDLDHPQALCIDRNSCLYVSNEGGKTLSVYEVFQES